MKCPDQRFGMLPSPSLTCPGHLRIDLQNKWLPKVGSSCLQLKSQKKKKKRGKVGGKESLLYFGCWQPGEDGLLSTGCLPLHPLIAYQWARALYRRGRGLCAETAQSTLPVISKLIMWWSDQRHLDCFEYS